eukprot:TRINITY_DN4705_c0_g1_i1.p1 TRINITY_DN4705_c0_g1~~TRINITY_DN4705_c0_g1_i1.p1  ORF type:complete len:197 (+),score=38.64 TRINITY_DN4705_c0_g1_i1:35-625(+)
MLIIIFYFLNGSGWGMVLEGGVSIFFFFFKQKTAYEMQRGLVGSEMCIRDRYQRRVHGDEVPKVTRHFQDISSDIIRSPGTYNARIALSVMTRKEYREDWLKDLKVCTDRISEMRQCLYDKVKALKTPGSWEFIINQRGLFTYLNLNSEQCEKLISTKHVYILKSGRMCIAGLNHKNIDFVAKAINEVVLGIQSLI